MSFVEEVLDAAWSSFYDNKPVFQAAQTVAMTLVTSTPTQLMYQLVPIDTFNGWDANTDTYTVQIAGAYRISAYTHFAGNATGGRLCQVRQNGNTPPPLSANRSPSTGSVVTVFVDSVIQCAVGDQLTVWVDQTSGGNLATNITSTYYCTFTAEWLRS